MANACGELDVEVSAASYHYSPSDRDVTLRCEPSSREVIVEKLSMYYQGLRIECEDVGSRLSIQPGNFVRRGSLLSIASSQYE